MKIFKLIALIAAVPLCLGAAELVDVAPEDVLLLAHFDYSTKVDKGNNNNAECLGRLTSNNSGFPFGKGKQEALDLSRMGRLYYLPALGNFDAKAGTLQMWVLPKWNVAKYAHCALFWLLRDMEKKGAYNWREFHLQKAPKSTFITAGSNQRTFAKGEIASSGIDTWMHLTLTWDQKSRIGKLYINGKLAASGKLGPAFSQPECIVFGGPKTWNAQAFIDEVRILKRVLTDAEVLQDYEAQKSGKPFTIPGAAEAAATGYIPEAAANTGSNTAQAAIDVKSFEFKAAFIPDDFKVDGNLNKAVWQNAPVVPDLLRSGKKMRNKTVIKILYSPSAIYFGASCYQNMSKITAKWDQDDQSIWNDDDIEIFLDVPGERGGFHQLVFNALGHMADLKDGSIKWNAANRALKAKRYKDRWDMEFKIPFASLGMSRPFPGDAIGLRICRAVRNEGTFDGGSVPNLAAGSGHNRRYCLAALKFSSGSNAAIKVDSSVKDFLPGVNNVSVTLKNEGKTAFSGTLKAVLQDVNGNLATVDEKKVSALAPGKSAKFNFAITIPNMDTSKMAFIAASGSREVGAAIVAPGFPAVKGGAVKTMNMVITETGSLSLLLSSGHPALKNAVAAISNINKITTAYAAEYAAALKENRTISRKVATKTAEHLNGFRTYASENRYMLWQTSPWEIGAPDQLPPLDFDNKNQAFNIKLAGNEREAVCFVVSGLFCNGRTDLRVVPSIKATKQGISTNNFDIFVERFINHSGDIISAPLIPVADGLITVTPGAAVRVWVVFNSRGVDPGSYKGEILIKSAYDRSIATKHIPFNVQVWNFNLPETHEWPLQSFMWGPNYNVYDESAMLRMVHAYHMTHGWSKSLNYTHGFGRDGKRNILPKGKKFDENVARTGGEEFLKTALELKMKFVTGWGNPSDADFYRILGKRFKDMGFKDGQFVFKALIRDEFSKAHIPANQAVRDEVSKFKGDWHFQAVYLSTPPPTGATMEDIEKAKLPEFYKMWTVIRGVFRDKKRGQDVIRRLRAKGCQVWSYNCSRYMQTQSVLNYFRLYAWECYLMGLDGMAFWTAMSVKNDPFDHEDGYDDGVMLAWHGRAPVPTKRFEAIREGLEDVAYMDRLKKEIARCKAKGIKVASYEKLLKECESIMKNSTQERVDSWRNRCGAAINELVKQ